MSLSHAAVTCPSEAAQAKEKADKILENEKQAALARKKADKTVEDEKPTAPSKEKDEEVLGDDTPAPISEEALVEGVEGAEEEDGEEAGGKRALLGYYLASCLVLGLI